MPDPASAHARRLFHPAKGRFSLFAGVIGLDRTVWGHHCASLGRRTLCDGRDSDRGGKVSRHAHESSPFPPAVIC